MSVRMSTGRRSRRLLWMAMTGTMVLLLVSRLEGSAPPSDPLPNVSCPVQPYKPAVGRFSTQYQGRRVYFCCDMCRAAFDRQPERYAAALPPPEAGTATLRTRLGALRDRHALVLSALAALAAWSLVQRRRQDPSALTARPAYRWGVAIVVLQAALIADLLRHRPAENAGADDLPRRLREKGEALANYAMMKQAVRLLAPESTELERTYYRGNDERDPRLFNGGFYRTATFHIAVVAGTAGTVRVGDVLGDTPLFVQLVIDRASGTAAGHFDEAALARYHFVRGLWRSGSGAAPAGGDDDAPGRGETGLEAVTRGWQWRARYPLGTTAPNTVAEGVLYFTHHSVADTSYGVYYRLVIAQGRLQKGSSLFMAAVYGADYPPEQWFSEKPIPEIVGSNTDDPVLLGLEPGAAVVGETPPPPRAGMK